MQVLFQRLEHGTIAQLEILGAIYKHEDITQQIIVERPQISTYEKVANGCKYSIWVKEVQTLSAGLNVLAFKR